MFDVLCDLFFALGVWKTWIGLIISVYLIFHANTVIRRAMFRLSAKAWPKRAVIAKYSSAILKSEDMHRSDTNGENGEVFFYFKYFDFGLQFLNFRPLRLCVEGFDSVTAAMLVCAQAKAALDD